MVYVDSSIYFGSHCVETVFPYEQITDKVFLWASRCFQSGINMILYSVNVTVRKNFDNAISYDSKTMILNLALSKLHNTLFSILSRKFISCNISEKNCYVISRNKMMNLKFKKK